MSQGNESNSVRHPATGLPVEEGFQEILNCFVSELPTRMNKLDRAVADRDIETIKVMTHQLKGCAAGYGFAELGERAALIEQFVREIDDPTSELKRMRAEVDGFIALCLSYCRDA